MAFRITTNGLFRSYANSIRQEFRVRSLDEYGAIFVNLTKVTPSDSVDYIVQLLNKSDKPVAELMANEEGRADFYYLKPADYYMRLIVDRNRNGKWDTGEYKSGTLPEEVYYFPQPIPLKAKFEIEQDWDYQGIPLAKQKPKAITKQKADKEKTVKDKNRKREEEKRKGK